MTVRVVIDTNVLVAALRSRRGASFRLVQLLGTGRFQPVISPPLCLEYEDVFRRREVLPGYTDQDISDFLDYFLSQCVECRIHFLWRPYLPDSKDDLVLELALAGAAGVIITHNLRDFKGVASMGIAVMTPDAFLSTIEER